MLKVPSVDETVQYWVEKGGRIRASRTKEDSENHQAANGSAELRSAFVELGCLKTNNKEKETPVSFALELVATNKTPYSIGNAISYIGVSMLLQFQNNLLGAIQGESPSSQGDEPNGIPVESAASAPGDLLARFALTSWNLEATEEFYAQVLGMKVKAQDETMLCLRYDNECYTGGVPTTLVFDKAPQEDFNVGDCFDHLVIATQTSIEEVHAQLQEKSGEREIQIFMKPTEMFGKQVMGVMDPNGYKVILASA